jgi:outer membrane lipopolysaccharide assembly protein LptE/RlpB
MYTQKLLSALMLGAALAFTTACHKHEHNEDDTTTPDVNITSPDADASLQGAVSIKGEVTDNDLHELSITITREDNGTEVFKKTPSVHSKQSYTIDETWTPSGISAETTMVLTVVVEDHKPNSRTYVRKFKVRS